MLRCALERVSCGSKKATMPGHLCHLCWTEPETLILRAGASWDPGPTSGHVKCTWPLNVKSPAGNVTSGPSPGSLCPSCSSDPEVGFELDFEESVGLGRWHRARITDDLTK